MNLKILLYLLLFVILFNETMAQDLKYEPGKIIVKIKADSQKLIELLENNRQVEFDEFSGILEHHSSVPFVSDASLLLLNKTLKNKEQSTNVNQSTALSKHTQDNSNFENEYINYFKKYNLDYIYPQVKSLTRIIIVEYQSAIDPVFAAKKISQFGFVEYAEPLPLKKIIGVPNDSLIYHQYYLNQIKIFDAWDIFEPDSSILIGIVDTGIDYNHEDMKDKIWINTGESGLDTKGNDKRTNGIDDDANGFVDDWRGWDFVSSDNPDGDNDPHPGHSHGTHVGGIAAASTGNVAGIAGIASGSKLMIVKVADDSPFATSVSNSYEGILYAASMGADVINCSWGSESRSDAEMEIISNAIALGSVIVAAAGNDGDEIAFYPAAHQDVISVASVDFNDERSNFSNYHYTVDIASPGEDIYSSIPNNEYDYMDGTSMASPVVAGVTALVRQKFPNYNAMQIKEHIKASSDNIDTLNPYFVGKIGRGRVNALKALQPGEFKSVILENYTVSDENNDNILDIGEKAEVNITIKNILSPLADARMEVNVISSYKPDFELDEFQIGTMNTLESKVLPDNIKLTLPSDSPTDYVMLIELMFFDGNEYINSEFISMIVNPSYRTMKSNNIAVTFNSTGNIAFNDYPSNLQGDGFKYKLSSNLLYEGALMIGIPPSNVSNVARASDQMSQDNSFFSYGAFTINKPGKIAAEEGFAEFSAFESDDEVAVKVKQSVYQFNDKPNEDIILVVYDIINTSGLYADSLKKDYDSLFAGLYFDWDIGPSGSNNFAKFNESTGFGYVKNLAVDTLPYAGVALLSSHKQNFFAIDNPGTSWTNPGVWDGFTKNEKFMMLSKGIYRKESSVTDVSIVIGAGPIALKAGDTTRVAFSIFSGNNLEKLRENCRTSRTTAKEYGIADGSYNPLPEKNEILLLYPNPIGNDLLHVDFALLDGTYITIEIFNSIGQKIATPVKEMFVTAGYQSESIKLSKLAQGRYYLSLKTPSSALVEPFEIVK
ncbi:MAG: S8 family serine peptidase [bacterium]